MRAKCSRSSLVVEKSGVGDGARGDGRLLSPAWVDEVFEKPAGRHDTRTRLCSSRFTLMVRVVCKQADSVRAASLPEAAAIVVSLPSVYNTLEGIPPAIAAAVVQESGRACAEVIDQMGGRRPPGLPSSRD